jgi:hypothetical protein
MSTGCTDRSSGAVAARGWVSPLGENFPTQPSRSKSPLRGFYAAPATSLSCCEPFAELSAPCVPCGLHPHRAQLLFSPDKPERLEAAEVFHKHSAVRVRGTRDGGAVTCRDHAVSEGVAFGSRLPSGLQVGEHAWDDVSKWRDWLPNCDTGTQFRMENSGPEGFSGGLTEPWSSERRSSRMDV